MNFGSVFFGVLFLGGVNFGGGMFFVGGLSDFGMGFLDILGLLIRSL